MSRLALRILAMLVAIVALTSTVVAGQPSPIAVSEPAVLLRGATVVDGTGRPAVARQDVLVRDGRIAAIGETGRVPAPDDARVLSLNGHTLLPGLVGLHEHTYFGGVQRVTPMNRGGVQLYLAFGVTTAMTAGSQLPYHEVNLQRAIDAGRVRGPRLLTAGPYFDGPVSTQAFSQNVSTAGEIARAIDYWAGLGATWFKFGGRVPSALLRAGIEAAHARGLKVTGHLCAVTFSEAADLGIDALQHGLITDSGHVPGKVKDVCPAENMRAQADVDLQSPAVAAGIRHLVATGTPVVSTLAVYETFVPARARLDPRAMAMLDPETRAEVEANHRRIRAAPADAFTVPEALFTKMMAWELAFVRAGGLLGAGSDPWGTGFLPGYGNARMFEVLIEAGFSGPEAVQILTLNGARILGLSSDLGSIEVGKRADLVVIKGDPLTRPSDIYEVVTVFKDGVGYDAAVLRSAAMGTIGKQ